MVHFLFHPENIAILRIVVLLCILVLVVRSPVVQYVILLLSFFIIYFFRAPELRFTPSDQRILCPTFGRVTTIRGNKVSIFLSVLDPHAQYAPCSGIIEDIEYIHGKFHPAQLYEKTRDNERCVTTFSTSRNEKIVVTQIAGFVARRILRFLKIGSQVSQGVPFGMIRFGSRVDIEIPPAYQILVKENEYVCGPNTILAQKLSCG